MRLLVLFLAIVLLPLRGWLGDAMALAPVQQVAAVQAARGTAHDAHAMHAAPASADVDAAGATDTPTPHAGHATCDTCQFCHSVAVTAWPEVPMPVAAPRHVPLSEPVLFASADAGQGFKPPIS